MWIHQWIQFFKKAIFSCISVLLCSCLNYGGIDLAPKYKADEFALPEAWRGESPFVEAQPSDAALRQDWWKIFNDTQLDLLEQQVLEENADLQAAAERFVQARDDMMKARSRFLPKIGLNVEASKARQAEETLFRSEASPIEGSDLTFGGFASWEPDFWSRLRNATRMEIYHAEEKAADFALARLSLQADLASYYFTLRGLDAQDYIYRQSIEYYEKSLNIITVMFDASLAGELDVTRAQYQLSSTQARYAELQSKRQVLEHAIATLVNRVPASFSLKPIDTQVLNLEQIPSFVPSKLLERRPDVASMERRMAQANRAIGMARAAFFPDIPIGAKVGTSGPFARLFTMPNLFWAVGAFLHLPAFEGGHRRAELQKSWSVYRETQDLYRSTVLTAFKEVEDGLTKTHFSQIKVARQNEAMMAASKQLDLSMEMYQGSLASSLDLISSQVNALESRLSLAEGRAELLTSVVELVRSLGGGWDREQLPEDDAIQPFHIFQYTGLKKPDAAGGIDVDVENRETYLDINQEAKY